MTTQIETDLIELIQMDEEPLYVAYLTLRKWGHAVDLSEFLAMVDRMIHKDLLRLWQTDYPSGDRTEFYRVPGSLLADYQALDQIPEDYDPFLLSIAPGDRAPPREEPGWTIECDFAAASFRIRIVDGVEADILARLSNVYPDVNFRVAGRKTEAGQTEVWGRIESRS